MTHYVAARYDADEHTFLPPLRTLGFNPSLNVNDSLLAQSYVEAFDISFPEALRRIDQEVEQLKAVLSEEGCYELSGIGTLSSGSEGQLTFEPCEAGLLTPELYGLGVFSMKSLLQAEPAAPAPRPRRRARLQMWHTAAAAVAVLMVCLLVSLPLGRPGRSVKMLQSSVLPALTMPQIAAEKAQPKAAEKPQGKAEASAEPQEASQPAPAFTIVLASQTTMAHAEQFVSRLHSEGLTEARVMHKGRMTRVVFGAFATRQEAEKSLGKARSASADAWVMPL